MANDFDYSVKKTLALWSAKNNALIRKWSNALEDFKRDLDELYECLPSLERDWRIRSKEMVMVDIQIFLDDLKTPCDSFISEFERVNQDEGVFSKELDIALSLDLKENG